MVSRATRHFHRLAQHMIFKVEKVTVITKIPVATIATLNQ